ncbi:MAG: glycosyltransferase family 4 protein [Pyrinomonadaceae bacterium]
MRNEADISRAAVATSRERAPLWILTEVYYPEDISTGHYLTAIAEGLAKHRTVNVLTGQPKHMSRGLKAPKSERRKGVDIVRTWGTTLDKNIFLFRLINMLTIGVSMFIRSLWRFGRGDQVLVVTAPPSLPVTTAIACLLRGASFNILVQDSYPEILVAVGSAKAGSVFVRTINFINRWVYKYASSIIVMGRDMNRLFTEKTAGLDVPIITIPNWADLETIAPTSRADNPLLNELELQHKFVFMYAGNIGKPTDVETILAAAEMLRANDVFHFVFMGSGGKKKWLVAESQRLGLNNVTILDYRPRNEQIVFLNACDVGLVALIKGMVGTAMPSRTYNIMAAGKPVLALAEAGSELETVVNEERIGWVVEPHNAAALTGAILAIYQNRGELPEIGESARTAAIDKYSADIAIDSYRGALDQYAV